MQRVRRVARWLAARGLKGLGVIAGTAVTALVTVGVTVYVTGVLDVGDDKDESQDPISVDVQSLGNRGVVVPKVFADLPPPSHVDDRCPSPEWTRQLGGVDADKRLLLVLQGRSSDTVVLDRVRVIVTARHDPMAGSTAVCAWVPMSSQPVRALRADIQTGAVTFYPGADPRPESDSHGGEAWSSEPGRFLFSLRRGDVEAFEVTSETGKCRCIWKLELAYSVGGKRGTITVPETGEPFETSGGRAPTMSWDGHAWRRGQARWEGGFGSLVE